jgi:serine/threonine-protein kinase
VKGKLAYMPREQLSGQPVTRQADLYAMGVVLWEALTGKRLFDDPDPARLAVRVLTESVPPPSHFALEMTPALDAVVMRATSHDPRRRYATADEMLAALLEASPRAEASAIADWLQGPAGDELEIRAERVHAVENYAAEAEDAADSLRAVAVVAPPPRWLRIAVPAGVALVVGVVATVLGIRALSNEAFAGAAPRPSEVRAEGAEGNAPTATTPSLAQTGPGVAPDTAFELDESPGNSTAAPMAGAHPGAPAKASAAIAPSHSARAKARAAAGARASCDPPYSIDANGWKHYKPQCIP